MKKINILLLLVVLFSSCEKYLDIEPKGKVILTKVEEYNGLFNDDDFLHGDYFAFNAVSTTDENWPFADAMILDNMNSVSAANFLWDESIDRVSLTLADEFYNRAYMRISRYNIIIQEVLDAEGTEGDKKEAYAKAQVLRAFNHFLLVNYYAKHYNSATASSDNGIILIKEFNMEQELVQSSVQEAYDFILEDINAALPNLKNITENTLHPSKAFGYALLAKVYLFMGDYAKAKTNAESALAINNNVYDLVVAHNNAEVVWGSYNLPGSYNSPEYLYYGGGKWGSALNSILSAASESLFGTLGSTGDIRVEDFYSYVAYYDRNLYGQRGEYRHVGAGLAVPEILLMKAECLARSGDASGAMTIVNDLRTKRILPANYVALTATDANNAVDIVIEERAREMLNTMNRFWDIRRLADDAHAITLSKVFNGNTYTTTGKSHLFIMPFPKNVTNKNSSIKQNTK